MAVLDYRGLQKRIRAAQKTQQITKTMQMVSASRLKKSQEKFFQSKPYQEHVASILSHLQQTGLELPHPFFAHREPKTIALVLVTSDRGLCGTYNANIIHYAETVLNQQACKAQWVLIGKKGDDYFKKRSAPIFASYLDLAGKTDYGRIAEITQRLTDAYLAGQFDAIYLIYTKYKSALSIYPASTKLLPIDIKEGTEPGENGDPHSSRGKVSSATVGASAHDEEDESASSDKGAKKSGTFAPPDASMTYLEPSCEAILGNLLPTYIASKIYVSLMEAFTSENSARMIAMKNATDNAKEMIRHLTLLRNKARQGAITKELLEIVTAGEALKR